MVLKLLALDNTDLEVVSAHMQDAVFKVIEKLRGIIHNHVGIIELAEDLDIETVTEIFIRVN